MKNIEKIAKTEEDLWANNIFYQPSHTFAAIHGERPLYPSKAEVAWSVGEKRRIFFAGKFSDLSSNNEFAWYEG